MITMLNVFGALSRFGLRDGIPFILLSEKALGILCVYLMMIFYLYKLNK
jgi:hypothetical protein